MLVGGLSGGGHATVAVTLAEGLARRGRPVDLLVFGPAGPAGPSLDPAVRVVDLRRPPPGDAARAVRAGSGDSDPGPPRAGRRPRGTGEARRGPGPARRAGEVVRNLPLLVRQFSTSRFPFVRPGPGESRVWLWRRGRALTDYLRERCPVVLFAIGETANLLALTARRNAAAPVRVVVGLHAVPDRWRWPERTGRFRGRLAKRVMLRALPQADGIVAVSRGVAERWSRAARIPRARITTIHNPVSPDLARRAEAVPDHPLVGPLFGPEAPPVVLGVGRLTRQKDFPTLMRAFASVREERTARLLILGEGPERGRLERLAASLGLGGEVSFPGQVENPYAVMARAALLALSSRWEGLPLVMIEALACGCPVVSTDCPAGPAEILEDGRYGRLTPVGDPAALAEAILATLREPPARERLRTRGQWFTPERAVREYARFLLDPAAS